LNEDPGRYDVAEALAARDRSERDALFANVAFGVSAAAAVAAGIVWLAVEQRNDRRLGLVPAAKGILGTVTVSF
jgi:hypothetical protein